VTLRQNANGWEFWSGTGWRQLSDPRALPTARQLLRLAAEGLLELRDRPGEPLTKLECAEAIAALEEGEDE
jgi:hypothetical protein